MLTDQPVCAAGPSKPQLRLRLERVQALGVGRAAWRLWLSPQLPPILLLMYRTNLKVEGVTEVRMLSEHTASLSVWPLLRRSVQVSELRLCACRLRPGGWTRTSSLTRARCRRWWSSCAERPGCCSDSPESVLVAPGTGEKGFIAARLVDAVITQSHPPPVGRCVALDWSLHTPTRAQRQAQSRRPPN